MDEIENEKTPGRNVIGWFEMPVRKLNDVMTFYQKVFGVVVTPQTYDGRNYGIIKGGATYQNDIYGALVGYLDDEQINSNTIHYFRAKDADELTSLIEKVENNKGKIHIQRTNHILLNREYVVCIDNMKNIFGIIANDTISLV